MLKIVIQGVGIDLHTREQLPKPYQCQQILGRKTINNTDHLAGWGHLKIGLTIEQGSFLFRFTCCQNSPQQGQGRVTGIK